MSNIRIIEALGGGTTIVLALALTLFFPSLPMITMLVMLFAMLGYLAFNKARNPSSSADSVGSDSNRKEQREHQLLLESIHHYPMPYAIYDEQDRLTVWNEQYQKLYASAFAGLNHPSDAKYLHYSDLLRSNSTSEATASHTTETIDERVKAQRKPEGNITDRHYPELGWYRVSKYTTPSGGIAGFAIDINELKQREADLMREVEHRRRLEIEIREIANTDVLTGIANRRHFMELANFEFEQSQSANRALSVLMMDIDLFKNINDSHGHSCGDEVISTIAKVASSVLGGETKRFGRLGGEEFAAILPGKTLDEASNIAEQIRTSVESLSFITGGNSFTTTISIGIATRDGADASASAVLKRADNALYDAKNAGRNNIRVSNE